MTQIVIGTAGHIDHGKTALVEALTGVNTDRLEEEKRRGMTIELGFAFLNDRITIIDVPGHEKFIRNMVAGVATIHIGLLVIAADDGVMPQTREHIHILDLLGLHSCVVALTKCDLAESPEWLDLVEQDIRSLAETTHLNISNIIRTSAATGEGIEDLRQELLAQAEQIDLPAPGAYFRLPVDRGFVKAGFGTIVTGTVISGECRLGDEVEILPGDLTGKVRKIQSHGSDVEQVKLGDRAALNIGNLPRDVVFRGTQIATPNWLHSSEHLIVDYRPLPKTKLPKEKQRVRIHIGTAEILARMTLFGPDPELDGVWRANLDLENPVYAALRDRYILRTYSPMMTIGGGKVLHPGPKGSFKIRKEAALEIPRETHYQLEWFVHESGRTPHSIKHWARFFSTTSDEIQSWLMETTQIVVAEGLLLSSQQLEKDQDIVLGILKKFHQQNPLRKRMNKENLRSEFGGEENWYLKVLQNLLKSGKIIVDKQGVALADHTVSLSGKDQKMADRLMMQLKASGFQPLDVNALSASVGLDPGATLEFLHLMKAQGKVLEFPPGLWLLNSVFDEMRDALIEFYRKSDTLSVPELKELFDITRKTGIPLIEHFDRLGWTRREGNVRTAGENLNA